jgi:hypothetical protein
VVRKRESFAELVDQIKFKKKVTFRENKETEFEKNGISANEF